MTWRKGIAIFSLFSLFILPTLYKRIAIYFQEQQGITVMMYALKGNGEIDWDQPNPLCQWDDPSTPQNEADTRYGCTEFDSGRYPPEQVRPYPYPTNPAQVEIEGDYLLDVVPREMEPSYHPLALRAQAIASRTYAYCAIRANEGGEDYWGNCRREINNSNQFQVFIPYYFDRLSSAYQQAVQEAVNETEGLYLIYAPEPGKGPIFAEFSADAYLRTASGDYGYLRSVENPISYAPAITGIISETNAHQRGMSQNGASRWGFGNSGRYGTGEPWPIRWEDYRQILVHYYTGVHLVDNQGNTLTPSDRWNLLNHTVPTTVTAGSVFTPSLMLQNTSTWEWWEEAIVLGYQWTASGASPLPEGVSSRTRAPRWRSTNPFASCYRASGSLVKASWAVTSSPSGWHRAASVHVKTLCATRCSPGHHISIPLLGSLPSLRYHYASERGLTPNLIAKE
ncbi:MAG: hypothetical protein H5T61_03170 [Thermoflexales bacterium]|nr:hypothetical protein [Thermoflexales bacterium]